MASMCSGRSGAASKAMPMVCGLWFVVCGLWFVVCVVVVVVVGGCGGRCGIFLWEVV